MPRPWILGAGAVGLGIGSALIEAGEEVTLIARSETCDALRARGLVRSGVFGERVHPPGSFSANPDLDSAAADPPPTHILVCVKSFDSEAAAIAIEGAALPEEIPIVLCQNGWGNEDPFVARFAKERIWHSRVITGFRRPAAHHVDVTVHAQPVHIGSLFGEDETRLAPLAAAISAGGLPAAVTADVAADLWAKMLFNGCLNPLGAVLGVPYGALAEDPDTRASMERIAREIFAVMHTAGFSTHWPDADSWLAVFHAELLPTTASHESSMLQDLRAGRRTEIDAITGAVVRLAERFGIAVPEHEAWLERVRALEPATG